MQKNNLPHIVLKAPPDELKFTTVNRGGSENRMPNRGRKTHAEFLKKLLELAWLESENEHVVSHASRDGIYIEFKGSPGYELATKSLEDLAF